MNKLKEIKNNLLDSIFMTILFVVMSWLTYEFILQWGNANYNIPVLLTTLTVALAGIIGIVISLLRALINLIELYIDRDELAKCWIEIIEDRINKLQKKIRLLEYKIIKLKWRNLK